MGNQHDTVIWVVNEYVSLLPPDAQAQTYENFMGGGIELELNQFADYYYNKIGIDDQRFMRKAMDKIADVVYYLSYRILSEPQRKNILGSSKEFFTNALIKNYVQGLMLFMAQSYYRNEEEIHYAIVALNLWCLAFHKNSAK